MKIDSSYYETIDQLEKMGVERDYIVGWIGGYMENPEVEEQRRNDAYSAGYEDGKGRQTTNAERWRAN